MPKIENIKCQKILNSRGDWTIRTEVYLDDGSVGVQTIPDGASKGENEAVYVSVDKAIDVVSKMLNDVLKGKDPTHQYLIDDFLVDADGSINRKNLGGNSLLSVSLAVAKAVAASKHMELYQYLSYIFRGKELEKQEIRFPTPVFNILNGGKHASNNLSFQEFMVIPSSTFPLDKSIDLGVKIYKQLKEDLAAKGYETGVGDEGGFAPKGFNPGMAFKFVKESASKVCKVGEDVFLGADVAAESFHEKDHYVINEEGLNLTSKELIDFHEKMLNNFEIIYYEDPFYEKDTESWKEFNEKFSKKLMVVGDDLVVTNSVFLQRAIDGKWINSVIVKPNQVGTLSETFKFIKMAQHERMSICVAHRSGETAEDTFIADLAVAVGAEFIKSGAPARGERVAKYNRLLEIYNSLK